MKKKKYIVDVYMCVDSEYSGDSNRELLTSIETWAVSEAKAFSNARYRMRGTSSDILSNSAYHFRYLDYEIKGALSQ